MMFIRKPTTLKDALQVLRKDRMHDYDDYTDTPTAERVSWLGIWEEEISMLRAWLPQAVVEKRREGTETFWRVDVTLAKPTSRTLLIRKADIIAEMDVGGEIDEVALGISDAAQPNAPALRRLPSGKLGWQDTCCLQLPVGLVPAEWQGRALLVTISLAPDESSQATVDKPEAVR
jgi:hypothetical protein